MTMKMIVKDNIPSLVRFDSLEDGATFFSESGKLCIKGQKYGDANVLVVLADDDATLAEYTGDELVEPVDIEITVTRRR